LSLTWYPDFCPGGAANGCEILISNDWNFVERYPRKCPHHAAVKALHVLDDQALFVVVLQSSRVKEAARWAAKLQLGLDKEHPGVPYRVESNGNFIIGVDRETGTRMGGWPNAGANRTNLITAINDAVQQVTRPLGTSTLTVG